MVGATRALAASLLWPSRPGPRRCTGRPVRTTVAGPPPAESGYLLGEPTSTGTERQPVEPFDLSYVTDDDSQGFVAVRPSAAFRRSGMGGYRTMLNLLIGRRSGEGRDRLKFDPTRPGQMPPDRDVRAGHGQRPSLAYERPETERADRLDHVTVRTTESGRLGGALAGYSS